MMFRNWMISVVFDIARTKLGRRAFNKYHTILKPSTSGLSTAPHISLSPTSPFSPFLSLYFFLLINSIPHLSFLTSFFLFPHIPLSLSLSPSLSQVSGHLGDYTRACSAAEVWEEQAEVQGPVTMAFPMSAVEGGRSVPRCRP
jgi:hypothetical protein